MRGKLTPEQKAYLLTESQRELWKGYAYSRAHATEARRCLKQYGEHGSLIAGVVRDHFPDHEKDKLRRLAWRVTERLELSVWYWKLAGRRIETWRRTRDEHVNRFGKGFYG